MKEIFFRGKAEGYGWVYGWYCGKNCASIFAPAKPSAQIIDENLMWHKVIAVTVGQFTGITDKNGKKIFEGDILYNADTKEYYFVAWNDAHIAFDLYHRDIYKTYSPLISLARQFEIVGNIYDNPELMEE